MMTGRTRPYCRLCKPEVAGSNPDGGAAASDSLPHPELSKNPYRFREMREELEGRINEIETRLAEIEEAFADTALYNADRVVEVRALREEQA